MKKVNKSKAKPKKMVKQTKAEKEQAHYEAGAKRKFIDTVIRNGGSVREITDPYGR
jgi:hypothetical protein